MTRLLQIWLAFCLYINCNALYDTVSSRHFNWKDPWNIAALVIAVLYFAGIAVLFSKHKKSGFYLMCMAFAANVVLALLAGAQLWTVLLKTGIAGPLITYLLMAKRWDEFS